MVSWTVTIANSHEYTPHLIFCSVWIEWGFLPLAIIGAHENCLLCGLGMVPPQFEVCCQLSSIVFLSLFCLQTIFFFFHTRAYTQTPAYTISGSFSGLCISFRGCYATAAHSHDNLSISVGHHGSSRIAISAILSLLCDYTTSARHTCTPRKAHIFSASFIIIVSVIASSLTRSVLFLSHFSCRWCVYVMYATTGIAYNLARTDGAFSVFFDTEWIIYLWLGAVCLLFLLHARRCIACCPVAELLEIFAGSPASIAAHANWIVFARQRGERSEATARRK